MPDYEDDIFGRREVSEQEVSDESENSSDEAIDNKLEGEGEVDESRRRILCGLGSLAISLPFIVLGARKSCIENLNPGEQYLGQWKNNSSSEIVTIERLPPDIDQPGDEIPLNGGKKGRLLLPIIVRKVSSCWHGRVGGIYEIEGHHALIIWCKGGADQNVVTALKKEGETLKMGLIESFKSLTGQMCVGHSDLHNQYNPKKWITYKLVE